MVLYRLEKDAKGFFKKHDILLLYSKTSGYKFNQVTIPHKSGLHDTGKVETFGRVRKEQIPEEQIEEIKMLEERGKTLEDWWIGYLGYRKI